jgi:hypothetical protein
MKRKVVEAVVEEDCDVVTELEVDNTRDNA